MVEGWLGLPAVAGLALVFGILRKELALQFLVALALMKYGGDVDNLRLFMDPRQIFVFALVTTIYFPCIATAAVLGRELGWRSAGRHHGRGTIGLAVLVGGARQPGAAAAVGIGGLHEVRGGSAFLRS